MDNQFFWWSILILMSLNMLIFLIIMLKLFKTSSAKSTPELVMTPGYLDELQKQAKHNFAQVIDQETKQFSQKLEHILAGYAAELEHGLSSPEAQVNQTISRILDGELKSYASSLAASREQLQKAIAQAGEQIISTQQQAKDAIEKYIEQQKKSRLQQIDEKMTDIVAEYIIASLGSEIDFSAQRDYIYRQLEANKSSLAQELKNVS